MSSAKLREERDSRYYDTGERDDGRTPAQRDRDRILYCSAFSRLKDVTQVVSASEGFVFHNRLTHTLKVAQLGHRLTGRLIKAHKRSDIESAGGLDPDVVEAAALAHDLGHPPFGHIAEKLLDDLAKKQGEGFEGNAQSFRIVVKLARRFPTPPGLDLTRATLNAILKYPHTRRLSGKGSRKFGSYRTEKEFLEFARGSLYKNMEVQCPEAKIMDFSDDVTYSTHDMEDFVRVGRLPLYQLENDRELDRFLQDVFRRWAEGKKDVSARKQKRTIEAISRFIGTIPVPLRKPYEGNIEQRIALRGFISRLIDQFTHDVSVEKPRSKEDHWIRVPLAVLDEVEILKELTWYFVINHASLVTQQEGQRTAFKTVYEYYAFAAEKEEFWKFPRNFQDVFEYIQKDKDLDQKQEIYRTVIDFISGLSEQQLMDLYRRLSGISLGSILYFPHTG